MTRTLHTMLPAYTAAEYWELLDTATREQIVFDSYTNETRPRMKAIEGIAQQTFPFLPVEVKGYIYESAEFRQYTAEYFKAPKLPPTSGTVQ